MKPLLTILCLALACCASPPRAIIPPPSEIRALNVEPVIEASGKTRKAVRDVEAAGRASSEAGRKVSDATRRLSDALARVESLTIADTQIRDALADVRARNNDLENVVMDLTASHAFAEERVRIALEVIDAQEAEIAVLKSNSAAQAVEIRESLAHESVLRKQVEALSKSTDDLVIAKDKLEWWRWAAGITWFVLVLYVAARILLRSAIPFRF